MFSHLFDYHYIIKNGRFVFLCFSLTYLGLPGFKNRFFQAAFLGFLGFSWILLGFLGFTWFSILMTMNKNIQYVFPFAFFASLRDLYSLPNCLK
jgi:hypothetical protein